MTTLVDLTGLDAQIRAADPTLSAFVSANAGSGKTSTLVNRVARLLLRGAEPETLLCVTYTKAAAAEMQRRLFQELGKWSVREDDDLRADLAKLEARDPDAYDHAHLSSARALFARALETPGGLKIQTIHAFCEKLLRRFPLEAGVSPSFEVVDDSAAADLAAEAREAVARRALGGDPAIANAYDRFSVALAFDDFEQMFRTFEARRADLAAWIGGLTRPLSEEVAALVGLDAMEDADAIERAAVLPPALDPDAWLRAAEGLDKGSSNDLKRSEKLRRLVRAVREAHQEDAVVWAKNSLFNQDGTPAKNPATQKIDPITTAWLIDEQARLGAEFERARAARIAWDTLYAMSLAGAYVEAYEAAKARHRVLDFADLVQKTAELLREREDAAWALYKLDEGIDHVLVDEAQDTAPEQWEMLRRITGDFFTGAGAEGRERPLARSVFVVGDEKQSIFSFQGAQPERLRVEAAFYGDRVIEGGGEWASVPLETSWRSTPEVLAFVDAVFAPAETRDGLLPRGPAAPNAEETVAHIARRLEDPGCIDLWPVVREEPYEPPDAWTEPVDARGPGAWTRLAERIATEIASLIERGDQVFDKERRVWRRATPGDVLVLVRKRGPMFEETIRALKRQGVPVAGADRLTLSEHPVFEDALALARFILFPNDDLTLAGVLRSPFCDVDEDSLFALAWKRKGSLWAALQARGAERPEWTSALAFLTAARAEAQARTPFDFYCRLYAGLDAGGRSQRTRLMTRLGPEAGDALDEFLAQVLSAEARGLRDLEGLAHGLARLDVVVKREMDEPKGEVRVMTAHGAKGLEAPIVFLPETVQTSEPRGSSLLDLEGGGFLWCSGKKADCAASKAARELRKRKGEDEALRLLYVALTRARDRVVLAGRAKAPPKNETPLKGWYPLVEAAFDHDTIAPRVRPLVVNGLEFRRFGHDPMRGDGAGPADRATAPLPDWSNRTAPVEPRALRWASPSEMADQAKAPAQSPLAATGGMGRFRRGELIHKLFELLPEVVAAEQAAVARSYLAGQPDLTDAQREEITAAVFAVLHDDRFAEVFGPGSRAEVALAGSAPGLPKGLAISGRLDRLVVTAERVLVVDYKTNRPAPARVEDADPAYLAQMAAYAAVLRALYPGRAVEAALLWTDGPKLTPISDELITTALQRLSAS